MKKRIPTFLSGMLTAALIGGLSVTALAASGAMTITVDPINIQVNGQTFQPKDAKGNDVPVFAYNGTTYAPLRALAEAYGLEVGYDAGANMATVKSPEAPPPSTSPSPEPTSSSDYSRTNPAPVGVAQIFTAKDYTVTMEISKVYRGQTAWAAIRDENRFNDPAPDGKEYILAAVEITVDSTSADKAVSISKHDFTAFSSSNSEYEKISVVVPSPELKGSAYAGGKVEGFVVFLVDKDDTSPKAVYGNGYDGTGGIWFSLTEE